MSIFQQTSGESDGGGRWAVYRRGADDGWKLGLMFIVIFLLNAYSLRFPVLGVPAMLLTLGVPVPAYIWLTRDYRRYPNFRFFSAVWMQGITLFFCASLILALTMYVFMRFIQPGFIYTNVEFVMQTYRDMQSEVPEAGQMADTLQKMIDNNMLPTPISLAVTMIWTITFFGSLLSLLLTFLIRFVNRKLS